MDFEEEQKIKNITESGVGKRYLNLKLSDYVCSTPEQERIICEIKNFIADPVNKTLWFLGNPGTGKTMLAAMICRECWGSHFVKSYQIESELEDCRSFKAKESRVELIKRYADYPLLVIDEIAKFESKEEIKYLFMILNERYENQNSTILITNKSKTVLAEYLGRPIFDRFTENCKSLEFNFNSYRINLRGEK